jgi:hypothetical protein
LRSIDFDVREFWNTEDRAAKQNREAKILAALRKALECANVLREKLKRVQPIELHT